MSLDCDISEGVVFIGKDCLSRRLLDRLSIIDRHFCIVSDKIRVKESAINRLCGEAPEAEEPPVEEIPDLCEGLGCEPVVDKRIRTYYLDVTSINDEHSTLVNEIEDILCQALNELDKINVNICQEGRPPTPPEEPGEEEEEEGGGEEEEEEGPPPEPCVLPDCISITSNCDGFIYNNLPLVKEESGSTPYDLVLYNHKDLVVVAYNEETFKWVILSPTGIAQSSVDVEQCEGLTQSYVWLTSDCLSSSISVTAGFCEPDISCILISIEGAEPVDYLFDTQNPDNGLSGFESVEGFTLYPVGLPGAVSYELRDDTNTLIASTNAGEADDITELDWMEIYDIVITLCEE